MQLPISLPALVFAIVALAVVASATGVLLALHRQRREQQQAEREQEARARVALKAAASPTKQAPREVDLSQSDVISIRDEIDRCIAQGRWDEGTKWAAHAVQTQPDRLEFQVKLAEIHCRAGRKREFTALFEDLSRNLPANDPSRARLTALARDIVPNHPLLGN